MQDTLSEILKKLQWTKLRKKYMSGVLLVLSLVVALNVFWALRQPGLTLAGDADCGIAEHTHDDACGASEIPCDQEEHVHSIACYSDETADVETPLDWQELFAQYPYTGDLHQDLVGIAQTQVGYAESTLNFKVDDNGIRRGYTRYGAWYSTPYSEWSATFVSFCLHYAGADPEETPGNTGANAMAKAWTKLGKYAPVKDYVPTAGDLVFFTDNTVGIVTEVHNATFYVICGDVDDAVRGSTLPLTDESIAGWGLTEGTVPGAETKEDYLLDISNGPAFFIFTGDSAEPQAQTFALRAARSATDLNTYLIETGGSYSLTLLDTNNQELPKDANGNYIAKAGTSYKLTLTLNNPDGFLPGTYEYHLPDGLLVDGGSGTFTLDDGTDVGTWVVTDDGLITMVFNEHMNSRTDVTISATMGIIFPEQEEPLDFDGKITVTVEKPAPEEKPTELNKWGKQGNEEDSEKSDPTKIYWTILITGHEDSQIPGSIITDQIKNGAHRYTQSDMEKGLRFGVSEINPVTGEEDWHSWTVYPGDPNLTWTETGWTYKIPETIQCWCGEVTLGNDGWTYYVDYTTTPDHSNLAGSFWYTNSVTIDGQHMEGWGSFEHGEMQAGIIKTGSFHGDADGGVFHWEFQATVPGLREGERAAYYTQITDSLRIKAADNNTLAYVQNDADRATVTAFYNGQTIPVPHVKDATASDPFAWDIGWSSENNGIYYTRALLPLCRCHCTAETCHYWDAANNRCGALHYLHDEWGNGYPSGFCYCWTEEQNTTFTFSYETNDPTLIEAYGGQGYNLQNEAILQNTIYQPDGSESTITIGSAVANVPIPGVFKKELTHDFDGYTANYEITVNEAKIALTNGAPLTIHDVMTQTLAFISGSLVITTEDANGNTATLQQGTDYTISYDGTGTATDDTGNPVHVLDIVILRPQPVMYILNYDATLVIPAGTTQAVKYNNSATITLWGEDMTDTSTEKVYADINIAAKSYRVEMHKKDHLTGEPLPGATFGLFNQQGGLITSDVTDEKGELLFQTNIIKGIILREHVLYYMQELDAPPGYRLDDTEYWFCFCNHTGASCAECDAVMAGIDAFRIPFEQIGKADAVNELLHYDLPATGGPGIYPFVLVGVLLVLTPLVTGFIRKRKRERRGDG